MWLSRRILLIGTLALAGCGFTPAYGPGGSAHKLQGQVLVNAPQNRDSYILVRQIEERLGRSSAPRYTLDVRLSTSEHRMAVDRNNRSARFNVVGRAHYSLRDAATGALLTEGSAENFTGYSASDTPVSTQSAQRDARERLSIILADQIVTRLIAAAQNLPS